MDNLCIASLLIIAYFFTASATECNLNTEGYYWRDFFGSIPGDALPGGKDVSGEPIYIGQVLHDTNLLPAKIYQNDPKAYYEWNGEQNTENYIKILCTKDPHKFEWIPRNKNNMVLLTGKHLVSGGKEPDSVTYIGRANIDGETAVGKVLVLTVEDHRASILVTKKDLMARLDDFEVLTYNSQL